MSRCEVLAELPAWRVETSQILDDPRVTQGTKVELVRTFQLRSFLDVISPDLKNAMSDVRRVGAPKDLSLADVERRRRSLLAHDDTPVQAQAELERILKTSRASRGDRSRKMIASGPDPA